MKIVGAGQGIHPFMIILNWNIKGLGDLNKRAMVRDFLYLFGIDVVAFQESIFCFPSFHLLRSIGGPKSMNEWFLTLLVLRVATGWVEWKAF